MGDRTELSASQEDYLEAIYQIVQRKSAARAKDISERLGVNNSSVTGALRILSQKGLVNYEPYDIVTLTPTGDEIAEQVVARHEILCDFLVRVLGIPQAEAEDSACKMEHVISELILERLVQFIKYVTECGRDSAMWREGVGYGCSDDEEAAPQTPAETHGSSKEA